MNNSIRSRGVRAALSGLSLAAVTATASAHSNINVTLDNASVVPSVTPTLVGGSARPASFGTATVVVEDHSFSTIDFDMVVYNIDVTGSQTPDPNDDLIGGSVHASATVTAGGTAPLVWGFLGSPNHNTSPADLVITPFSSGVGGAVFAKWDLPEGNGTTLTAEIGHVINSHAYIQFATTQFPNGEIRWMIPEPGSASVFLLSATGLLCRRRGK